MCAKFVRETIQEFYRPIWHQFPEKKIPPYVNSGNFDDFSYCFFEPELTRLFIRANSLLLKIDAISVVNLNGLIHERTLSSSSYLG